MDAIMLAELRGRTLDEMAAMFADASDELRQAIANECDRRDRATKALHARRSDPVYVAWREAAYSQYLQAERECIELLSDAGKAAKVDDWSLWSGPMWRTERYASWELLRFWETHQRITIGEFRRQARAARDAELDQVDRARYELPTAADLIELVRSRGPEALDRYAPEVLAELLDYAAAADWLGLGVRSVRTEVSRGRWPESDLTLGRSPAWTRRTLVIHRATMPGRGAPGKSRPQRKAMN